MSINKVFLDKFLNVLGRDNCPNTSQKIEECFSLQEIDYDESRALKIFELFESGKINELELQGQIEDYYKQNPSATRKLPELSIYAYRAIDDLYWLSIDERYLDYLDDYQRYPDKVKTIEKFNKSIINCLHFFKEKDVEQYFQLRIKDEENDDNTTHAKLLYKRSFLSLLELHHEISAFTNRMQRPQARPKLDNFYKFVLMVSGIYEDISEKKFTVDRFKENGEYVPITDGMRFVWVAVEWLHDVAKENYGITKQFTSKNITYTCEKARKNIENIYAPEITSDFSPFSS